MSCDGPRAIVVLSVGSRPFFEITRPLMELYAERVGAALHFVTNDSHPSLVPWRERLEATPRFLKLPLLDYHLQRYARVLLIDDDVVISPNAGNLFQLTPCDRIGATVEVQKPLGWHAQHFAAACNIYNISGCNPRRDWRIFNSGVVVLSAAHHRRLTGGWEAQPLTCRILCDQLYLNAAARREGLLLRDLGAQFNYVGSELRRAMLTSAAPRAEAELARRRAGLADACFLHLTRKVPKHFVAHWALARAKSHADVLQCSSNGTGATNNRPYDDRRVAAALAAQVSRYDIGRELCKGHEEPPGCRLQPWAVVAREESGRLARTSRGGAHKPRSSQRRRGGGKSAGAAQHVESGPTQLLLATPPDHVPMAPDHLP